MPPDPLGATAFGGRLSEPPFVKSWIRPSALQLLYLFKSFRKYRISHNYAMPQVMPHAILQTHDRAEVSCQFTANSFAANSPFRSVLPIRSLLHFKETLLAAIKSSFYHYQKYQFRTTAAYEHKCTPNLS